MIFHIIENDAFHIYDRKALIYWYFEIALLEMENRSGNFPEISNVSAFCRLVENNKN